MLRRSVSLALILLGVFAALALVGVVYETRSARADSRRFPPPGRLVDVGGRRLHLICTGEGEPTVIFEPSILSSALSFQAARSEVGAHTRVCAYDRMGMGWSDPGPRDISVSLLADDLLHLLDRAGLKPPYILVPSSVGGLTVEMFARRYPERVSGLVFVDAADSAMAEQFSFLFRNWQSLICLAKPAGRLGLLRLLDPLKLRRQPPESAARAVAITYRYKTWVTVCAMIRGIQKSARELQEAPPLRSDVPLVVLSHQKPTGFLPPGWELDTATFEPVWQNCQQRLARRSKRGTWRIVPGSSHLIAGSQPHAVAEAILEMLAEIRRREADGN